MLSFPVLWMLTAVQETGSLALYDSGAWSPPAVPGSSHRPAGEVQVMLFLRVDFGCGVLGSLGDDVPGGEVVLVPTGDVL